MDLRGLLLLSSSVHSGVSRWPNVFVDSSDSLRELAEFYAVSASSWLIRFSLLFDSTSKPKVLFIKLGVFLGLEVSSLSFGNQLIGFVIDSITDNTQIIKHQEISSDGGPVRKQGRYWGPQNFESTPCTIPEDRSF
jgi:hypothetical protein